jgi:hypothetical protein
VVIITYVTTAAQSTSTKPIAKLAHVMANLELEPASSSTKRLLTFERSAIRAQRFKTDRAVALGFDRAAGAKFYQG